MDTKLGKMLTYRASEYMFLIFLKKITRRQKAKETKEKKIISVENLTGYNDIVCEFALCTFNLID